MFTTGEFSRIARVSKRLLQYYDEQDLLHPAYTDAQTGYRHYAARQLTTLNRILALKEIGLSLADIRAWLSRDISQAEIKTMLRAKRAQLQNDVQTALQRLRILETRLDDADNAPDVIMKALPAMHFASRTATFASVADAWPWLCQLCQAFQPALARDSMAFSLQLLGDSFEAENFSLKAGFTTAEVKPLLELRGFAIEEIPERPAVATVVQVGGPELAHRGCAAIGRYIERYGFRMVGPPREVFIELPLPTQREGAMVESQFEVVLR